MSQTVQQMGSTVSLSTSDVLINAGLAVTFTATVTGASGGTPSGTVTFLDGSTVLGTATLSATNSGMAATFTTTALAAGVHSITAVYAANTAYTGSSSAAVSETIQLFDSTTSLLTSADTLTAGQSLTLTAMIAGIETATARPSGTVTFFDGTTVLGTVALSGALGGMQAILTTAALGSGTHSITAVYNGDGTFAGSTVAALTVTVEVDSTTATLTSSALGAAPGQSVTFTVTVSGADGGTPTGTVTFEDGSTVLGTATLSATSSGSQATFSTSSLAAGSHSVTVIYSGDSNYTGSTSIALGEMVEQVGSIAMLSSSANPATSGQSVTFTATLSGTAGQAPTGTITFEDGSTVLGTASLSAITSSSIDLWSAQATFTTSSLATGTHTIQAIYSGDGSYTGGSATLSQNVSSSSGTQSTTTLSSSATSAAPGQVVTFTATVTSAASGTPTGTVTFLDGSTVQGTASLSAATSGAQATYSISTLANGTHVITTVYSGDSTFAGSSSNALLESVRQATGTTTTLTSSLADSAPGQAVTFTATVSGGGNGTPTGTVTFEDGTTVLGTVALSPGLNDMGGSSSANASFTTSGLTLGTHSITAVYSGNNVFTTSTATALDQTVQQGTSTTSVSSSADTTELGQPVTFTAAVSGSSGATPTGSVTFLDGTTVLGIVVLGASATGAQALYTTSALAIGSHAISAVYSGDNNFIGSAAAAITQTVDADSTATLLSTSASSIVTGQSVSFTATVTSDAAGTPTGTVTFEDGNTVLGTASLSWTAAGGDVATFSTSTLSVGVDSIAAVYGGDNSFAGSTSVVLNQIVSDGTTLDSSTTLTSSSLLATTGEVVTFTATVNGADGGTPTGTVTFEDGSTVLGTGQLSAGSSGAQASFSTSVLAAGTHSISAIYNADSNYSGSASLALSETIQAGPSAGGDAGSSDGSGDPASGSGSTATDSLLGSSSGTGTSVADLFDGQLYAAAGIPTQLSANSAASSATSTTTTTTQSSGGNTPASLPQGPLDASSSNLALTDTYQDDYTEWGSNSFAAFYIDVNYSSTCGPSGTTGSTTYTSLLEVDGILVVDEVDVVVPFSNSNPYIGGSSLGAPPPTGGVGGYQLSDFGFDLYDWDQLHYRESTSDNLSGTYTASNAGSYAITQKSTATYSWDSTRVFTSNGEGTGDGTAVYTDGYKSTWMYYLSVSDAAGNFASNTQYDANGYPTDLFGTPVSGTTFLARTFNSGSSSGTTVTTCSVVDGEDDDLSSVVWSNTSSGITASSYKYNNTATVNGTSSGNSDTVSWNTSQQSTGNYGGSDSGSYSFSGYASINGTTTTSGNSSGQSSSNATLTDTYQRSNGDSGLNGTLRISSSGTQNYSGQSTEKQTYSADNVTADTVQYSNSSGGNSSVTASNSDSYSTSTLLGSGEGTDFAFSNSWNQGQSMARGTNDLVAKTGSGSALSIASSGGTSITFSTGSYDADVDSFSTSATSFLATTGNSFATSAIAGKFKADGTQTSGTSYSFKMGSGGYGGFTTSQYTAADYPSSTYAQTFNGSSSGEATTSQRANSDGSASGSAERHGSSSATTDTTTTLVGTEQLSNGTAVYNNKSHSNDVQSGTSDMTLQLQAGSVSGTAAAANARQEHVGLPPERQREPQL